MRCFVPFKEVTVDENINIKYQEDLKRIKEYLRERGVLNISDKKLYELYCAFSDNKKLCSWIPICDEILEEFMLCLSETDVHRILWS